jgi:phage-related minor tail protein
MMGRGTVNMKVFGVREALEKAGREGARTLVNEIDKDVERSVRQMANDSAEMAPVKTGRLAGSIPKTVRKVSEMAWEYGSDVEYATRQEYEHKSRKGFFRKSIWTNRQKLRDRIRNTIKESGR